MAKRIQTGDQIIDFLERNGFHNMGEDFEQYKDYATVEYTYSKGKALKPNTPRVIFTVDAESDAFLDGYLYPDGSKGYSTDLKFMEDLEYFLDSANWDNAIMEKEYDDESIYGTLFEMIRKLPQDDQDYLMDNAFDGTFLDDIKDNPKKAYDKLDTIVKKIEDGSTDKVSELLEPYKDKLYMMKNMLKDYGNFTEKKNKLKEGISYKYTFSGDRYVDYVLSYWLEWWNRENNKEFEPDSGQLDEMFLDLGFDKLAEIIFREFPITAEVTGQDFDAEYCWEEFLRTKEGQKAEEWLEDNGNPVIDNAIVNEYLDMDLIAESIDSYWIDEYLKTDKDAKSLKKADKDEIRTAFIEGVPVTLSNGFSFSSDEYAEVVNTVGDDLDTTEEDLRKLMGTQKQELRKGNILVHTGTYNPRLYNGADIDFVFEILMGKLIYDILHY